MTPDPWKYLRTPPQHIVEGIPFAPAALDNGYFRFMLKSARDIDSEGPLQVEPLTLFGRTDEDRLTDLLFAIDRAGQTRGDGPEGIVGVTVEQRDRLYAVSIEPYGNVPKAYAPKLREYSYQA